MNELATLESLAENIAQGWEPEIRLASDAVVPQEFLFDCLERFAEESADTRILLQETVLSGTDEALLSGDMDIVLTGRVPPGYLGVPLFRVEFVAVAHAAHPLHHSGKAVTQQDLRQYRQIVVRDSGSKREQDSGWLDAEKRWTVSSFSASVNALCRGFGFAWIPRPHIAQELDEEILRPLPLEAGLTREMSLKLVLTDADQAGPATETLAGIIKHQAHARWAGASPQT